MLRAATLALCLVATPVLAASPPEPPPAMAHEPLFADIVSRAKALHAQVEAVRGGAPLGGDFKRQIGELAELDMQAHRTLAERDLDGDLKCILRGIAEDLPEKLAALEAATDAKGRDMALRDMAYLLKDNVEVILAPPQAPV
ncbi:MAG: hypothetical protein ACK41C_04000 [Phenylobacterium sp.]|uniref:hypothetical protein n=1 Tax=Phenylobacterium sp. TaxID=1871053 RepID=UPI00391D1735